MEQKGVEEEEKEEETCKAINTIWEVLGRRWALLILADRLLEMEREGLISKKIYPEIPPKVEYRLTARSRELGVILKDLEAWAQRWRSPRIASTKIK